VLTKKPSDFRHIEDSKESLSLKGKIQLLHNDSYNLRRTCELLMGADGPGRPEDQ